MAAIGVTIMIKSAQSDTGLTQAICKVSLAILNFLTALSPRMAQSVISLLSLLLALIMSCQGMICHKKMLGTPATACSIVLSGWWGNLIALFKSPGSIYSLYYRADLQSHGRFAVRVMWNWAEFVRYCYGFSRRLHSGDITGGQES